MQNKSESREAAFEKWIGNDTDCDEHACDLEAGFKAGWQASSAAFCAEAVAEIRKEMADTNYHLYLRNGMSKAIAILERLAK